MFLSVWPVLPLKTFRHVLFVISFWEVQIIYSAKFTKQNLFPIQFPQKNGVVVIGREHTIHLPNYNLDKIVFAFTNSDIVLNHTPSGSLSNLLCLKPVEMPAAAPSSQKRSRSRGSQRDGAEKKHKLTTCATGKDLSSMEPAFFERKNTVEPLLPPGFLFREKKTNMLFRVDEEGIFLHGLDNPTSNRLVRDIVYPASAEGQ